MKSTVMNTSKEMSAYSDFPPPANFCNFMHHSKVLEYLKNYAKANDLYQYVRFNTTVQQVIFTRLFNNISDFIRIHLNHLNLY